MDIPRLVKKAAFIVAEIRSEIQRQHAATSQEPLTEHELTALMQAAVAMIILAPAPLPDASGPHPMLEAMEARIKARMRGFTAQS